ncbi:MAG: MqnA/MqnD/SBP family protein [Archaeoglobaceae archaeon]
MRVAHTPDADDAFMFYAMLTRKIPLTFEVENIVEDIETLNKKAFKSEYEVTALSVHGYALVSDRYRILSAGASVGDGYGPIVVAKKERLENAKIAIPGRYTTANLLLKLAMNAKTVEMRFDEILQAVKSGKVDAGLLIHEAQLNYEKYGLKKVLDLYEWWFSQTRLPLPLGINAIRRDLGNDLQVEFLRKMRESIIYALNNVEEALSYAEKYSRGLSREELRKFVLMYVNEYSIQMPPSVLKAMDKLFEMAEEKGMIKKPYIDVLYDVNK